MSLVRVFGNTYLNPSHVGKLELEVTFNTDQATRTNITRVWDATGLNVLLEAKTVVSTSTGNSDKLIDIKTDNLVHNEIVLAIHNSVDARHHEDLRNLASTNNN